MLASPLKKSVFITSWLTSTLSFGPKTPPHTLTMDEGDGDLDWQQLPDPWRKMWKSIWSISGLLTPINGAGFHPAADIQSRTGIGAARSHVVDISIIIITKANEMISSLWVWDQICTAKPTVRAADFVNIIIYFFICNIQAWDFAAWSVKKNRVKALFSWPFLLANFLHFKTFLSLNFWANSNLIFLLYCSDPRLI